MDLSQAGLIALVIFVAIEGVKRLWVNLPSQAIVPLAAVLGVAATFLVSGTVWAHEQVIGGVALDNLNTASKIVAGLLFGALAVGIEVGRKAISSIGENQ